MLFGILDYEKTKIGWELVQEQVVVGRWSMFLVWWKNY